MTPKKKSPGPEDVDSELMGLALAEGANGHPSPNPHVGAVVAQGREVIAVGHHERAGEEHAEVMAFGPGGRSGRGGDALRHARAVQPRRAARLPASTPSSNRASPRWSSAASIPTPTSTGGGAERLRAAGIEVKLGVREREARALIAPWTKSVTTGLPHVSLKLALSLDGRIATRTGASKWVTGPEARAKVHELRSRMDAVAVGIGTVVADDPRLTVREVDAAEPDSGRLRHQATHSR